MNRNRQENDPQRDQTSRARRGELGHVGEDLRNRDESDLGRAQAEGNLGNERTRNRGDERERNNRDNMGDNRNL
ncbi:MAG TPA: hypothetical protein VM364_09175 [Vicinamibacterales bacterium]|nr:hypothetical protein [Vicinamibacterales bacterium]